MKRLSMFSLFRERKMTNPQQASASASGLRLLALDAEDLGVLSAHMQDAVVRIGDISYSAAEKRFMLAAARFDWIGAENGACERCACGLALSHVLEVQRHGVPQHRADAFLNLLAISFIETDAPSGWVRLDFSGDAAIQCRVECLEAQLRDLGPRWTAGRKPGHALEG